MKEYNSLNNNKKYKILFVCFGNICRSPAAQAVMERIVSERGISDKVEIDSAGMIRWKLILPVCQDITGVICLISGCGCMPRGVGCN